MSAAAAFRGSRRYTCLALSFAWAVVVVVVMTRYHVNEPLGMKGITTNGHTYYGNPPALTLEERDPFSCAFITTVMGVGLIAGALDLAIRRSRHVVGWGTGALVAGGALVALSLLGLLLGLASVGVVGALLILAAMPLSTKS